MTWKINYYIDKARKNNKVDLGLRGQIENT